MAKTDVSGQNATPLFSSVQDAPPAEITPLA
jgi:hypothetical protein